MVDGYVLRHVHVCQKSGHYENNFKFEAAVDVGKCREAAVDVGKFEAAVDVGKFEAAVDVGKFEAAVDVGKCREPIKLPHFFLNRCHQLIKVQLFYFGKKISFSW